LAAAQPGWDRPDLDNLLGGLAVLRASREALLVDHLLVDYPLVDHPLVDHWAERWLAVSQGRLVG
jgi:hypothetical protein